MHAFYRRMQAGMAFELPSLAMNVANGELREVEGTREWAKVPLLLLAVLLAVYVFSFVFTPEGKTNWALEVGPSLIGVAVLLATFRRFPMSRLIYVLVFIHSLILIYGGYYTYAKTPLGDFAMHAFDLSRNHYDRVGHLALGFFPALIIKEVLLRKTPLQRGGWLTFLVISTALAIGAFYELIEWWATLVFASDVGAAFLGSQGDVWDAQWDMFLAIVGSSLSLLLLGRLHDRSMAKLFAKT